MNNLLQHKVLFINQIKEWAEIIANIETKNAYEIRSEDDRIIGNIAEMDGGFFAFIKRMFFRSHRPLDIAVFEEREQVLNFKRGFFFFFSDLFITDNAGREIGSVHRRFAILNKVYDLRIGEKVFATVKSPIWRLWTFPIFDSEGKNQIGVISKKWQGILKESFTDADKFMIDYGEKDWSMEEKATILGLAISIDFDFFEDNQGRN